MVVLQEKKHGGHYLLMESSVRDEVPGIDRSPVQGEALGASRSGTRQET